MKALWATVGIVAACAIALASTLFARFTFLIVVCGALNDTGGSFPAYGSAQGRLCDPAKDDLLLPHGVAAWTITIAGLVAVVLVVAAWRWGGATTRVLSVIGLVALPLLMLVPLSVPADTCTTEVRQTPGGVDCRTSA